MAASQADIIELASKPTLQLTVITAFVILNLVAPFLVGEVYPYTISPLFSDEPKQFAVYEIFDSQGRPLLAEKYHLQSEYHGYPAGVGAGVLPAATLNSFGEVADETTVRKHMQKQLMENARDEVTVHQKVYGAIDSQKAGMTVDHRWIIKRGQ